MYPSAATKGSTGNQILHKMSVSDRAEAFDEITHSVTRRRSDVSLYVPATLQLRLK